MEKRAYRSATVSQVPAWAVDCDLGYRQARRPCPFLAPHAPLFFVFSFYSSLPPSVRAELRSFACWLPTSAAGYKGLCCAADGVFCRQEEPTGSLQARGQVGSGPELHGCTTNRRTVQYVRGRGGGDAVGHDGCTDDVKYCEVPPRARPIECSGSAQISRLAAGPCVLAASWAAARHQTCTRNIASTDPYSPDNEIVVYAVVLRKRTPADSAVFSAHLQYTAKGFKNLMQFLLLWPHQNKPTPYIQYTLLARMARSDVQISGRLRRSRSGDAARPLYSSCSSSYRPAASPRLRDWPQPTS